MSKTRALFLLGGGLMQLPALEAARRLDLQVHLADGNPRCRARDLADVFYHIDLKNVDELYQQARKISGLAGVFTAGTDFSSSVAYVAERLGLPGIPHRVSIAATDKSRMREVLERAAVAVPKYFRVGEINSDTHTAIESTLRYPMVVKPVDNMGARGVLRIDSGNTLVEALKTAQSLSRSNTAIVEELIDGVEYSLDAIVTETEVRITGLGERHIFFEPYFVELGHTIPATLLPEEREVLEQTFRTAIRAIGITRGAAKGDVFLTRDESGRPHAVIGEIAARLSGGFMSGWTYPYATEVPLTEIGIRVALGETPPDDFYVERKDQVSVERALISAPGKVREVVVRPPEKDESILRELFVHCAAGDEVGPPSNNVEKIANAIATAGDRETAEQAAAGALDRVVAHLEVGNEETERFLFVHGWDGRFARYGGDSLHERVRTMDPVVASQRIAQGRSVGALPVTAVDLTTIRTLQVGIDGATLFEKLCFEGIVIPVPDDGTAALGSVFWRAFLSAGRQGVAYLVDAIDAGRLDKIVDAITNGER